MQQVTKIKAYHLRTSLNVKAIKAVIPYKIVSETGYELFCINGNNKYFFIVNYGAVVFYNVSSSEIDRILNILCEMHDVNREEILVDDFGLAANEETFIKIDFSDITVNTIDEGCIKVVMLNLAQSIALNYYDLVAQELIAQVRLFTTEMEQKGKLNINNSNILKFIGRSLNTQNRIAENLYIFDAPEITWENEYYNTINTTLAKHFELNPRYRSIENTIKITQANLQAFLEVNHHRESSRLEWIIIILILVEVIDTFVMKFM